MIDALGRKSLLLACLVLATAPVAALATAPAIAPFAMPVPSLPTPPPPPAPLRAAPARPPAMSPKPHAAVTAARKLKKPVPVVRPPAQARAQRRPPPAPPPVAKQVAAKQVAAKPPEPAEPTADSAALPEPPTPPAKLPALPPSVGSAGARPLVGPAVGGAVAGAAASLAAPAIEAPTATGAAADPPVAKPAVAKPAVAKPAENKGSVTSLPLPRWAALRADDVNLRVGPGMNFPIDWQYHRRDLPVKILRELEVWRLIEDEDGVKGWVHSATLTGRRGFVVKLLEATMRASASDDAAPVARLKPGVVGRIRACAAAASWCEVQVGDYRGWLRREQFFGTDPGEAVGN